MYDTVLVPVDGSTEPLTATEEAVEIASPDGTIHALSVIEKLPMHRRSGKAEKFADRDETARHERAAEATEAVEETIEAAGLDCVRTVTEGVPYREIATYAEEIDADAIVIGKRDARESAGDILGSTTERILKRAPTTVVAVPTR